MCFVYAFKLFFSGKKNIHKSVTSVCVLIFFVYVFVCLQFLRIKVGFTPTLDNCHCEERNPSRYLCLEGECCYNEVAAIMRLF